jgi:hypothetical protein
MSMPAKATPTISLVRTIKGVKRENEGGRTKNIMRRDPN